MAEDKWSTTASDGAGLAGIEPAAEPKREKWVMARGTKGLAQEKGQLQVCLLHTHTDALALLACASQTAREDIDPARTQHATHSDTIFSVRRASSKLKNEWSLFCYNIRSWLAIRNKILQK